MSILGISASGRLDGITSEAVRAVLDATGLEYECCRLYIWRSDYRSLNFIGNP